MEPLYIAVCEDQPAEQEALLALLAESAIPCVPTVFSSGEALLSAWQSHVFDLLLIDIYMGGITGVETVRLLRDQGEALPVAFITSSVDHALDSYRLSALKYMEKPVSAREIAEILELAWLKKANAPSLTIQRGGNQETIPLTDLCYLEQQRHVVHIHRRDGSVETTYDKVSVLAGQLMGQDFFQPHKSFLVHLAFVGHIDPDLRCFVMADGKNIPIRRELLGKARQAWEDYLFSRTRKRN